MSIPPEYADDLLRLAVRAAHRVPVDAETAGCRCRASATVLDLTLTGGPVLGTDRGATGRCSPLRDDDPIVGIRRGAGRVRLPERAEAEKKPGNGATSRGSPLSGRTTGCGRQRPRR